VFTLRLNQNKSRRNLRWDYFGTVGYIFQQAIFVAREPRFREIELMFHREQIHASEYIFAGARWHLKGILADRVTLLP